MKILGVDYGKVRTGLAVSDRTETLASPLPIVTEYHPERLPARICQAAREQGAELVVIGLPRNMDGTEGDSARAARALAQAVEQESGLPVELWDERCTTVDAHRVLNVADVRGKKRKQTVDSVAAVLILEGYLDFRRSQAQREQP